MDKVKNEGKGENFFKSSQFQWFGNYLKADSLSYKAYKMAGWCNLLIRVVCQTPAH